MNTIRNMKRPRLATILAGLALFVAIGGTATAASKLINGKNIKKGTVTAKQIKNKTITPAKLSSSAKTALKGDTGAKGATGQQGPKGNTGAPGKNGTPGAPGQDGHDAVVIPQSTTLGSKNIGANVTSDVLEKSVPSGKYFVSAKLNVLPAGSAGEATCQLIKNGGAVLDTAEQSNTSGDRANLALEAVTPISTTSVKVSCTFGASAGSALGTSIIALPVN